MPELKITIRNKRASGTGTIVCGNSDYTVLWDLDEEWASFDTKTMRVQLPDGTHQDVVFTGNSAGLPVQNTAGWVSIGLFAGDVHTSRGADFRVLDAITTAGGPPAAPAKDVYAQVMAKLNQLSDVTAANVAAAMGLSGLAADDQIMVSAVDADGKPTGWRKKYRDMLNVRDFGAKGDSTTDDTAAIQAALDAASTRGISAVLFPTGTYKVSATTADNNFFAALTVHSGQRLLFDAATLQLTANGYDFYAVLNIHNVNNVTVEGGLTIIGDRESHTATTGESGHGIRIVNSHNVHVSDVDIRYTWGDGVCVGGNGTMDEISQNVTLERIRTYKCSRNGLSIIEADGVVVRDCDFTYTDRTAPQYGIDVEPNLGTATNITIENVRMLNNGIGGFALYTTKATLPGVLTLRNIETDAKTIIYTSSAAGGTFDVRVDGWRHTQKSGEPNPTLRLSVMRPVREGEVEASTLDPRADFTVERNLGFLTAAGAAAEADIPTVRACIARAQVIRAGSTVQLRLLEDVRIDETVIPRNTPLYGTASLGGDRLQIVVSSVEYGGRIFDVEAAAYDMDGQRGLNVPDSRERTALKEALASAGQTAGTSVNITRSAGQQVLSELARGGLQASSRYVAEKLREVKVTLKADHRILLISKQQ